MAMSAFPSWVIYFPRVDCLIYSVLSSGWLGWWWWELHRTYNLQATIPASDHLNSQSYARQWSDDRLHLDPGTFVGPSFPMCKMRVSSKQMSGLLWLGSKYGDHLGCCSERPTWQVAWGSRWPTEEAVEVTQKRCGGNLAWSGSSVTRSGRLQPTLKVGQA